MHRPMLARAAAIYPAIRAEQLAEGWVSQGYYGLDQGSIVMMIENYRSGLIWD